MMMLMIYDNLSHVAADDHDVDDFSYVPPAFPCAPLGR